MEDLKLHQISLKLKVVSALQVIVSAVGTLTLVYFTWMLSKADFATALRFGPWD